MRNRDFNEMMAAQMEAGKNLCVGLDTDVDELPRVVKRHNDVYSAILDFNREIMRATADIAAAFKPNIAFYEGNGEVGERALRTTIAEARSRYPKVPIILDAKRADIGKTNKHYVKAAFDVNQADALTINPYFGQEAVQPFLDQKNKGLFVLCKTSNKGSAEFQDKIQEDGKPLFVHVARNVAQQWNANNNCGLVVGATYPEQLAMVREVAPNIYILAPGVGTQGGNLQELLAVENRFGPNRLIINSSSGIIYASKRKDFAEIARATALDLDKQIREAV